MRKAGYAARLAALLLVLPFAAGCTTGTIPITENHSALGTGGQTARESPPGSMRQTPGADAPAMTASAGSGRVGVTTTGHASAAAGNFNGGPTGSAGHATGGSGGSGHGGGSAGAGH